MWERFIGLIILIHRMVALGLRDKSFGVAGGSGRFGKSGES